MIEKIKNLVKGYAEWLEKEATLDQIAGEWVEITLPFLDRHNDYISVFVRKVGAGWEITDSGLVVDDLELSGATVVPGSKLEEKFKEIARGLGVHYGGYNFVAIANDENFSLMLNSLVQSVLSASGAAIFWRE